MSAIGQSRGTPVYPQENDTPPLSGEKKKAGQEKIQNPNHVANHKPQTPLPRSKEQGSGFAPYRNMGDQWVINAAKNGDREAQRELHARHFQGEGMEEG